MLGMARIAPRRVLAVRKQATGAMTTQMGLYRQPKSLGYCPYSFLIMGLIPPFLRISMT